MKIIVTFFIFFFLSVYSILGQEFKKDTIISNYIYPFTLIDGQDLFTMKQTNQNYLSTYRLTARLLNKNPSKFDPFILGGLSILGLLVTHEEGHRSILTELGIGSISQPFSIFSGAAYVKGVTDETLINLRNSSLPNYIRLHTAGLEADYMITTKTESLIALEEDSFKNLEMDYYIRKLSLVGYYLTVLIPKLSPELEEEQDELERDIVGNDIYGAVRHLHRPTMDFYRYTNYDDFTSEEMKFAKKVSYLSFLNLINPIMLGKSNFKINDNLKVNAGLGYTLAPFGGFIDENFWFVINNKIKIHSYLREFHNKENWFMGFGIKLLNYRLYNDKVLLNTDVHFWSQPENLSFITSNKEFGYGGSFNFGYKVFNSMNNNYGFYLNAGLSYKQKGFIPEYSSLDEKTQFDFGFSFAW